MIDVYYLDDISVEDLTLTRSGRVTIHETKKKCSSIPLCKYSALVVGVVWVIANEILAALREKHSQGMC